MITDKRQIFLILIGLCVLVYANSLHGAFVSDDINTIVKEPDINNVLKYILAPPPLLNTIAHLVGNENPFWYHFINLVLHSVVTVMVFYFLRFFFAVEASFLGAAVFAVHPLHTEAVSWISGKAYPVITFFVMSTYFLYRRALYADTKSGKINLAAYTAALSVFLYFIISQISFFALTAVLIVFSDCVYGKWRQNWKWWLPFFVLVGARLTLARMDIVNRVETVAHELGVGKGIWDMHNWSNPLYNMAYSLFEFLRLLVWPQQLTLYHEPPVITRVMLNIEIAVMGILVLALPFIYKKAKPVFFGLGLYVIFFIPTYSPILISWLVAERYAYFPSVAFCIWLCFAYEKMATTERRRKVALTAAAVIIAAYGVRTVIRNEDWKDPQRLWRATVEVSGQSPRAHNNMGDAYAQEDNFPGAIREFKAAISLKPDYADAYHNLANIYQHVGNLKESVVNYETALSLNPMLFESYYNLAVAYMNTNEPDKAVRLLLQGLQNWPNNPDLGLALTIALKKKSEKK